MTEKKNIYGMAKVKIHPSPVRISPAQKQLNIVQDKMNDLLTRLEEALDSREELLRQVEILRLEAGAAQRLLYAAADMCLDKTLSIPKVNMVSAETGALECSYDSNMERTIIRALNKEEISILFKKAELEAWEIHEKKESKE